MVLSVRPRKNFAKETDISTTQNSSHVEITNEDKAHHLLRYHG